MNYNTVKYKEFYEIISEMDQNPVIQEMKKYRQHYDCSCYDHCLSVAYYSFCLCKKLKLDYTSMARAAFVHDLFLYDWRFRENVYMLLLIQKLHMKMHQNISNLMRKKRI